MLPGSGSAQPKSCRYWQPAETQLGVHPDSLNSGNKSTMSWPPKAHPGRSMRLRWIAVKMEIGAARSIALEGQQTGLPVGLVLWSLTCNWSLITPRAHKANHEGGTRRTADMD